jgi:hypothetical protein
VLSIFEIDSHFFAWSDFELWSSQSLPP